MAETVKIQGLDALIARFGHTEENLFSRNLMSEIGIFAMFSIKRRTAEGRNVRGQFFKAYSPKYKLFREKAGHPTGKVTLFFTGSMMASMTHSATEMEAEVFFQNTSDRSGVSNPLKAFALNEERRFFALSKKEQDQIAEMVGDHINDLLAGR